MMLFYMHDATASYHACIMVGKAAIYHAIPAFTLMHDAMT